MWIELKIPLENPQKRSRSVGKHAGHTRYWNLCESESIAAMVLDQYVRDLKAFMDDFATALDAERTKFYLDTSVLIWLIRLGSQARAEVLAWFRSRPAKSACVPVWVAHELHRHILGNTAKKNLTEIVGDLTSRYDDFVRMAAERADDLICSTKGYENASSFITELELTTERLNHLTKVVVLEEDHLRSATKEVIDFANERILTTDLTPIVRKLKRTGKFRVTHLMPPAFGDRIKDENTYGDIVIWEEIMGDIRGEENPGQAQDVVFISRDKKTDWVSAAPYVVDSKGLVRKANRDEEMDVTEAHPLLVHELLGIAGGKRLYITQPGFLASVIDYGYRRKSQPSTVKEWLRASHKPELLSKLAGGNIDVAPEGQKPPVPSAAVPAAPVEPVWLPTGIPKDFVISSRVESASYQKAAPQDQTALVDDWIAAVQNGSLPPARFGGIFAELVTAGATGVKEQVPALYERLLGLIDADKVREIVLATITAAYFDGYGELRTTPDLALGSVALVLEKQERFKEAFETVNRFLKEANAELPYVPGAGTQKVKFIIDHAEVVKGALRSIREIRINEQSVLIDALPRTSKHTISALLGKDRAPGCSGQDVRLLLARQFLIPLDCLSENFDRNKFTWQPDAGLVTLDTSSPGGLSANVDEEDEQ